MELESDVAIVGTGLAALVAANHLVSEGKSVLLLNPEWDFFGEESELPLDPTRPSISGALSPQRLVRSDPERAIATLRPGFPGAIEVWPQTASGFRVQSAPYVRARARLWIDVPSLSIQGDEAWERLEETYVEASDAGLKPQVLEGISAVRKFPGASAGSAATEDRVGGVRGLLVPRICDADVDRYRRGLLEYLRERVGSDRVVSGAAGVEVDRGEVRYHARGQPLACAIRSGVLIFWTPRLTALVQAVSREHDVALPRPRAIRLWEHWSLVSREALDASVVGFLGDTCVWAECDGSPDDRVPRLLSVLRPGATVAVDQAAAATAAEMKWASAESFQALSVLCLDFLGWEGFSIRSFKPRAIFEWNPAGPLTAAPIVVAGDCDGPIFDVVQAAREAASLLLKSEGA